MPRGYSAGDLRVNPVSAGFADTPGIYWMHMCEAGQHQNIRDSFPVWVIWRAAEKSGLLGRQTIAPTANLSYRVGN